VDEHAAGRELPLHRTSTLPLVTGRGRDRT
jgi:hypothetical protein